MNFGRPGEGASRPGKKNFFPALASNSLTCNLFLVENAEWAKAYNLLN